VSSPVTAYNGGRSPSPAFLKWPHASANSLHLHCHFRLNLCTPFEKTVSSQTALKSTELSKSKSKSLLYYDQQSVGQSVLVSGPATNFSHSLFDYFLDSFGFVDVGLPLWREVGSVLFSFYRASPAQPFSDLSPTGLISIVYCVYILWLPQSGGPSSCICFLQEQGSPVITQGIELLNCLIDFPSCNLSARA
jgi:hypothetical protein